jgi:hypothetical protein
MKIITGQEKNPYLNTAWPVQIHFCKTFCDENIILEKLFLRHVYVTGTE